MQRGRPDSAEPLLRRAAELDPANPAVQHDHGLALRALGRLEDALQRFDRAVDLARQHPTGHYNRGAVLLQLNRPDEAIQSLTAAIVLKPDLATAYNERANALRALNRPEEAVSDYERAVALAPQNPTAHVNLGFALQDLGHFERAMECYDRAIAIAPDCFSAYRSRGTLKLVQGKLPEGFADYEWRRRSPDAIRNPDLQRIPYWRGEPLNGKSIVIYDEGAFGDIVQFCRYLPVLARKGAWVKCLMPSRFHRVLNTSSLGIPSFSILEDAGAVDLRCELLSLPFHLKTTLGAIPPPAAHLAGEPQLVEYWRAQLPKGTFNVGICWQGNPVRNIDAGRSVPLAEFEPLARVPGVRLISVQKHHGLDQLESLPPSMHVDTLTAFDEGADAFLDTAAVMESLDLVVTSDTAIAHLAGTLGRPTWIALRPVPEWRWLLDRSDSPWYPSVRLFRQSRPGQWAPVFREMAVALREIVPSA